MTVPLEELDLSKLEIGKTVECFNSHKRFVRLTYDGGNHLHISLAKDPSYCYSPQGARQGWAGITGACFTLTEKQHSCFAAFEQHVVKHLEPMRVQLLRNDDWKASFSAAYRTKITGPKLRDRFCPGLPFSTSATLNVHIENNNSEYAPKIKLVPPDLSFASTFAHFSAGNVGHLTAGCKARPVISTRGIYAGPSGFGCRFTLTQCDIVTAKME